MKQKNKLLQLLCILCIALIITINFLTPTVKAEDVAQNEQEFNLSDIGMKINIDTNFIEIITALQNRDERVNSYETREEYLQSYKKTGILLDAVDNVGENKSKEIIVMQSNNTAYYRMPDFNKISEEDFNKYQENFINSILEQAKNAETGMEIISHDTTKTQNGNVFIHIVAKGKSGESQFNMSTFYTIMNKRLITISYRYFNQEIDEQEVSKLIEGVSFETVENKELEEYIKMQNQVIGGIVIAAFIILIVVLLIRRRDQKKFDKEYGTKGYFDFKFKIQKYKNKINRKENANIDNSENVKIKDLDKATQKYSLFGGFILLYFIICIYQVFIRITDITSATETAQGYEFYKIFIIIQSIILLITSAYITIKLVCRKKSTPRKIQIALIAGGIAGIILTIIRMIYAKINPAELYTQEYYSQEVSLIISYIFYTIVWTCYFKFSKRVKIYYQEENKDK